MGINTRVRSVLLPRFFTTGFILAFLLFLAIFLFQTSYNMDGIKQLGFPFVYYSPNQFNILNLLLNIIIALAISYILYLTNWINIPKEKRPR